MSNGAFDFDAGYGVRYAAVANKAVFGYESLFEMAAALLRARIPDSARILVVGSGPGAELATFGSRMPGWQLLGVDPSEQMIRLARARIVECGIDDRVELRRGYVSGLADTPEYDAATLILVLHFVPDDGAKLALLKDIARRVKAGGTLVLVDLGGDVGVEPFRGLLEAWKAYIVAKGMTPDAVEALIGQALETQHFVSESRLLELLAEAGFGGPVRFYSAFLHSGWIATRQ